MENTMLLVMEMQNDFLWAKRKDKFTYDAQELTAAVNAAVQTAAQQGQTVLFVKQIFPDTPTNHLAMGFCIEGTEGAELYTELQIPENALILEKNTGDLFTEPAFAAMLNERGIQTLTLCGIDECGGIAGTAKGAAAAGLTVQILQNAAGTRFDTRMKGKTRMQLKALGVRYVE